MNYSGWGDIGQFSSSYATNNWTNLGIVASPSAYDVLGGMAANPSAGAVFTGGGYSNVFNFGIGGSYAYQYGASLANWYGPAYANLNGLGGTFVGGQGSARVQPPRPCCKNKPPCSRRNRSSRRAMTCLRA